MTFNKPRLLNQRTKNLINKPIFIASMLCVFLLCRTSICIAAIEKRNQYAEYQNRFNNIKETEDEKKQIEAAKNLYQEIRELREYKLPLLELKLLTMLKDCKTAGSLAEYLLRLETADPNYTIEIGKGIAHLCQNARQHGNKDFGNEYENKLLEWIKNIGPSEASYSILKYALFQFRYQLVDEGCEKLIKNAPNKDIPLKFLILRAHTRSMDFLERAETQQGTPNEQDAEILRKKATQCTKAHEEAFEAAETEFQKTKIAHQWWSLMTHKYYDDDSRILRKTVPFIKPALSRKQKNRLQEQTEKIKQAALKALNEGRDGQNLTTEQRKKFASNLANDFKLMGVIGVPDSIFEDLLDDLPLFCDIGLDGSLFITKKTPLDKKTNFSSENIISTMHFHLWYALIAPMSDRTERNAIDKQIKQISSTVEKRFDKALDNPRLIPVAQKYAAEFQKKYNLVKDNRFFSYFKRAWYKSKRERLINKLNDGIKRIGNNFQVDVVNRLSPISQQEYIEEQEIYFYTLKSKVWMAAAHFDGPMFNWHLPDAEIDSKRGAPNKHDVYNNRILKIVPFKDFPWKKPLTDEEKRTIRKKSNKK